MKTLTSSNFITGTGLKKCRPPNLSNLPVALAISLTDNEEVFVVKMVCLSQITTVYVLDQLR